MYSIRPRTTIYPPTSDFTDLELPLEVWSPIEPATQSKLFTHVSERSSVMPNGTCKGAAVFVGKHLERVQDKTWVTGREASLPQVRRSSLGGDTVGGLVG